MPETQRTPERANDEARTDWAVLDLLIGQDEQRPWSVEEIIREHRTPQDALDGISRLYGAGLIHKTSDGFIFATRAAIRFSQIVE
jgi:hypothetical protein